MQNHLEVDFENLDHSGAVEARIHEEMAKLEKLFDRITSARVVVYQDHRQHRKGNLYGVRIQLHLPAGKTVVVGRNQSDKHAHEDVNVALRDAFNAARRQLMEAKERIEGKVKTNDKWVPVM